MSEIVPSGDMPEFAQRALTELREQQRIVIEKAKLTGLNVLSDITQWAEDVAKGKVVITEYTMKGEPYTVDGRKYLFENADKLKAAATAMDGFGGKREERSQIQVAILGRTKAAPRKLSAEEVKVIEIVEE